MAQIGSIYVNLDVDIGRLSRFRTASTFVERESMRMRRSLSDTTRGVHGLRGAFSQQQRVRLFGESLRTITRTNDEVQRLRASLIAITAIGGGGLTGALSAAYLLQTADRAKLLSNQIRTVTENEQNRLAVEEKLYGLAQKSRASLNATATIYARTARASQFFALSQEKVLRITETIQKAFAVGGATQAEAFGAAIQLSQGIASNRFSGEEFRSVSENAPVLLNAIARSLGVTIGKLREMAHAGELTAEVVTDAILRSSAEVDEAFKKTEVTVGQSITRLDNAFLRFIGDVDETYGVTFKLAQAISNLAENFDEIASFGGLGIAAGISALSGRLGAGGAGGFADAVRNRRAQAQAELADLRERNKMIKDATDQNQKAIIHEREKTARTIRALYAKQSGAAHDALEREYTANQRLMDLESKRGQQLASLEYARRAASQRLSADIANQQVVVEQAARRLANTQAEVVSRREGQALFPGRRDTDSRGLERAISREAKETKQYEAAVAKLRSQMAQFDDVKSKALNPADVRSMTREIAKLDKEIATTQAAIRTANVEIARVGGTGERQALGRAIQVREESQLRLNKLQEEARNLAKGYTENLNNMTIAMRRSTVSAAALGTVLGGLKNVWNFFGGAVGVGLGVAIFAMIQYSRSAAKANEQTRRLTQEMVELGYLTEDAAKAFDDVGKSIDDMELIEQKRRLREYREELEKLANAQGPLDTMFNESDTNIINILRDLSLRNFDGGASLGKDMDRVRRQLFEMATAFENQEVSAETVLENLQQIAEMDLSKGLEEMVDRLRRSVELARSLNRAIDDLEKKTTNPGGLASGFRRAEDFDTRYSEGLKRQREGESFLQERRRGEYFDMTEFERSIEKAADKLVEAAEKAGKALPRGMAIEQARFEEVFDRANKSLLDLIGYAEGTDKGRGYNETLDYGRWTGGDANLVGMTLQQILELQRQMLANPENRALYGNGRGSSAVGRYQIVRSTLTDLIGSLGLDLSQMFTPELQDRLAMELVRRSGGTVEGLRGTWEGLKRIDPSLISRGSDATAISGPGRDETIQNRIDLLKQQAIASGQAVDALELEQKALDMSAFERERLTKIMELENAHKSQNIPITDEVRAAIEREAMAYANAATSLENMKAVRDLVFEREQMFRAPAEQRVQSTLRDLGVPVGSAQGEYIANQVRLNEELKFSRDLARDFAGSFVDDLREGIPVVEALGNAFDRLADKLIDMALDGAINSLFQGLSANAGARIGTPGRPGGGGAMNVVSGILSIFGGGIRGFASGGYTGVGNSADVRGLVHANEFVVNSSALRDSSVMQSLHTLNRTGKLPVRGGFTYAPTFYAPHANSEELAALKHFVKEQSRTFKAQVVDAMREYDERATVVR